MFTNLIESGSHKRELERKGTFFLGTLAAYGFLIAFAGIVSIYAYDAHLSEQNMNAATLVTLSPAELIQSHAHHNLAPKAVAATNKAIVSSPRADLRTPAIVSNKIDLTDNNRSFSLPGANTGAKLSDVSDAQFNSAPSFASGDVGNSIKRSLDSVEKDAPRAAVAPHVATKTINQPHLVSLGVINGKALHKPVPIYPTVAKLAHVAGTVTVQVLLNEEGKVIAAHVTNGHPLLRDAALQAAYQARFSPTLLSKQPVKVSGTITYNFVLE
jgi:protein TonB